MYYYTGGTASTYNFEIIHSFDYQAACKKTDSIARLGVNNNINVEIKNIGRYNLTNTWIELVIDSSFMFISATPMTDSIGNGRLFWKADSIKSGQKKYFTIEVFLSANILPTTTYQHEIRISRLESILCSKQMANIVFGSYDPNEMYLLTKGNPSNNCIAIDSTLTYRIDFQNTRNDTAINVKAIDYLNKNHNISTLKLLGSSHAMNTTINKGELIFNFPGINLLDSHKSYSQSCGYIIYSIQTHENAFNKIISNYSDIYFDFNSPIKTNILQNFISDCIPLNDENNPVTLYPNPSNGNAIKLSFFSITNEPISINIFKINYAINLIW